MPIDRLGSRLRLRLRVEVGRRLRLNRFKDRVRVGSATTIIVALDWLRSHDESYAQAQFSSMSIRSWVSSLFLSGRKRRAWMGGA